MTRRAPQQRIGTRRVVMTRRWRCGYVVLVFLAVAPSADAQPITPPARSTKPQSYADLYKQEYKRTYTTTANPAAYTINRVYYHNPNISPYLNLTRPGSSYVPKYQAYVEPEIQRRQSAQAMSQAPNHPGRPVPGSYPATTPTPNPYYGRYFGK